jgi:hypothetical protein
MSSKFQDTVVRSDRKLPPEITFIRFTSEFLDNKQMI